MRARRLLALVVLGCLGGLGGLGGLAIGGSSAGAAPALGPGATLRQKNEALAAILRDRHDDKHQKELHALAGSLLDYAAFVRASLADDWQSVKKRDELVAAFRQMLEARYLKELRAQLDYQVEYAGEELEGGEATVTTIVQVGAKGGPAEQQIVYKLRKVEGAWRVHDIISDEISLVRNYKTQFHKILATEGVDQLIAKLKAKQP